MPDKLKELIKNKYGEITRQSDSCCSSDGCGCEPMVSGEDYATQPGYTEDADFGLGCGIPTRFINIQKGDIIVDLGSGAGNDLFIARRFTGEEGYCIGIDMTEEMLKKAEENNNKLGYKNVEFRLGDIENIPVDENMADIVISNCVINLVPDKNKAFQEIYRILKPGGKFCISDIVIEGEMPDEIRSSVEMYVGCVAGAISKKEYLDIIKSAGFSDVEIVELKKLNSKIPEIERLELNKDENFGVFSATFLGEK
ncbi:Methyltransferase type 11 [Flexistipes sinusarabici DSM 4947]|uniref:Arsenite methyltransferase n=1 Tax=Flexistipes sinusarabici (strain ATCC 49648 / DSM 4947 / MAS 10) TaxID=717231 RepID=F8E537_FLESM|nr:arsenite methyltransferase [Flexistipes sinusarabici]AEI15673.1 Methyltransferase type 11 [Flexistipes sinusarabici DSM 4947]